MKLNRKPTLKEERLIEFLIEKSSLVISGNWKKELTVCPMNDGMMGSLYLFPKGDTMTKRRFGRQISDFQFKDIDGIEAVVSLPDHYKTLILFKP